MLEIAYIAVKKSNKLIKPEKPFISRVLGAELAKNAYITVKKKSNHLTFLFLYVNQMNRELQMNKKEVAESIYKKLDVKRFEAYSFIDLLIELVIENLKKGDKLVISNFGTFRVIERQEKRVINPNDKIAMIMSKRKIVKFLPSKNLKDKIRN